MSLEQQIAELNTNLIKVGEALGLIYREMTADKQPGEVVQKAAKPAAAAKTTAPKAATPKPAAPVKAKPVVVEETSDYQPTISYTDVQKVGQELAKLKGREVISNILSEFTNKDTGEPAQRLTEIAEGEYAAVATRFKEELDSEI
jgi:hypothetical protein